MAVATAAKGQALMVIADLGVIADRALMAIVGRAADAASEARAVVGRVATTAIADPAADVGSGMGRAAADPEVTVGPAADVADKVITNRVNERARDFRRGPARLVRSPSHFLLFSYSSTHFFGLALNSSRHPVQQT
jgi:hypothetical protein